MRNPFRRNATPQPEPEPDPFKLPDGVVEQEFGFVKLAPKPHVCPRPQVSTVTVDTEWECKECGKVVMATDAGANGVTYWSESRSGPPFSLSRRVR